MTTHSKKASSEPCKTELELTEYKDIEEAQREAADDIRYYNLERKHSALESLTPARFEQLIHHPK